MRKLISVLGMLLLMVCFMGAEGGGCGGQDVESTSEEGSSGQEGSNLQTGEGETWSDTNVALMVSGGWKACRDLDAECDDYSTSGCIEGIGLCAIPCSVDSDCDAHEATYGLSLKCETEGLVNLSGRSIMSCAVDSE